jgi:serine/threonine-protein kinase
MPPNSHAADRNLLFGIIALQMDFISRDQLIAAMNAWVLDKHKPLGQVLSEQGGLSPEDHEAIDSLVRRHLLRHDNDAERSLAALSAIGQRLRDDLGHISDPEVQASLPYVGAARGDTDSTLSYVGSPTTPGGRFRILRPHAQGGLGVVSVALDEELHREVALKEIQERYASDEQQRLRFLLEAEITGGLEHPGIVPVYGLGHHPDGRPFYAMRFVRGESLKEAVARFHARTERGRQAQPTGSQTDAPPNDAPSNDAQQPAAGSGPAPRTRRLGRGSGNVVEHSTRTLELRRLLSRFLDVCNAIAYAQSRGVLHRDIKPANILLGPYGETLVVDWGLAKVTGRAEPTASGPDAEPTLRPPSASGSGETIPGTALGTPAYMSPEQAEGCLDLLGPRSDVYSLGATLYVMLTGRPPFDGNDDAEVLPKVRRGEFASPRAISPSIPKALEAICKKAMALKQADRYANPRLLAEDVEHWLADEPVVAYPEPWPDRARRWSRKHRTLATSSAAVLLLALMGSVGFAAVVTGKNRELARQTRRAEAREQMAIDAVKRFRDVVVEEPVLQHNPTLEELRKNLLKAPLAFFRSFREELERDKETRPEALARLAYALHDYAHLSQEIGDIQDSLRSHVQSLAIWESLVRDHPERTVFQRELAAFENCRGSMLHETGHPDQALDSFNKVLTFLEHLTRAEPGVTEFQIQLALVHRNIGIVQSAMGHPDQASKSNGKALAIWERLAREDPDPRIHRHLAKTYEQVGSLQHYTGHPDLALEWCAKGLMIRERLARENFGVTAFQSELAGSHAEIARLQNETGHPDLALESYGKALAIKERLAKTHPESPDYASDLGATLNNMAMIDLDAKRFPQARDQLQQATSWQEKALAANPRHPTYRQFLRSHLRNLIRTFKALGNDGEVSAAQRELDELAATDPAKAALDTRTAAVLRGEPPKDIPEQMQLADRAYEKKLYAASTRLYGQALEVGPKLADDRQAQHRYNAACAATLAAASGTGPSDRKETSGRTEKPLTNADRAEFRNQARAWLEAELEAWSGLLESDKGREQRQAIAGTLEHWREDTDLTSVRDKHALDRLPEGERAMWRTLWADVDRLLKKALTP